MLPDKLEKLYNTLIDLVLADAQKAATATFSTFQLTGGDAPTGASAAAKKEEFTKLFTEYLYGKFVEASEKRKDEKSGGAKKLGKKEEMEARISKYSLLSTEEMDAQIAAEMQARVLQTEHRIAIGSLSMRVEKIVGHPFVLLACPAHPQHLAMAFKMAVDKINDNKKMTAAAFQAWLKVMKASYAGWIEALNQQLIKQMILPDLDETDVNGRYKNTIEAQKVKSKEIRQSVISEITGKPGENAGAVLPQELMASLSVLIKKASIANPELQAHVIAGAQKGPSIDTEDVVKTLKEVKAEVKVNPETGYRELANNQSLAEIIKTTTSLSSFMLNEQTQNAIAMLSMMFSKMNQEESIAAPVKPLLSDLQVPILKRALKDEKFFMDTENSAQQLVNEIAKAGSKWTPGANAKKDIFYNKISSIVDEVKEKHEEDDEVFNRNLQELSDFMEKEDKRTGLLEERLVEMEQAEARAEAAHSRARGAIAVRLLNKAVPPVTRHFIDNDWEKVLFYYNNLSEIDRSEDYKQALADLEHLIELATGTPGDLKALIVALNKQMDAQGRDKSERQESLQGLANELKVIQHRIKQAKETGAPLPELVVEVAPPSSPPPPEVERAPDSFDQLAEELSPNSWFHFQKPGSNEWVKVKLVAIIKSNTHHVFVSREGVKMLTCSRKEVADKLRDGTLKVIETNQIFDRTLESVIKLIRHK